MLDGLHELLSLFHFAMKVFENEKQPTLSLTIPVYNSVKEKLARLDPQGTLCQVWTKLKDGLDKRMARPLNESNACWNSVFFDPRSKNTLKGAVA